MNLTETKERLMKKRIFKITIGIFIGQQKIAEVDTYAQGLFKREAEKKALNEIKEKMEVKALKSMVAKGSEINKLQSATQIIT